MYESEAYCEQQAGGRGRARAGACRAIVGEAEARIKLIPTKRDKATARSLVRAVVTLFAHCASAVGSTRDGSRETRRDQQNDDGTGLFGVAAAGSGGKTLQELEAGAAGEPPQAYVLAHICTVATVGPASLDHHQMKHTHIGIFAMLAIFALFAASFFFGLQNSFIYPGRARLPALTIADADADADSECTAYRPRSSSSSTSDGSSSSSSTHACRHRRGRWKRSPHLPSFRARSRFFPSLCQISGSACD